MHVVAWGGDYEMVKGLIPFLFSADCLLLVVPAGCDVGWDGEEFSNFNRLEVYVLERSPQRNEKCFSNSDVP